MRHAVLVALFFACGSRSARTPAGSRIADWHEPSASKVIGASVDHTGRFEIPDGSVGVLWTSAEVEATATLPQRETVTAVTVTVLDERGDWQVAASVREPVHFAGDPVGVYSADVAVDSKRSRRNLCSTSYQNEQTLVRLHPYGRAEIVTPIPARASALTGSGT